MKKQKTTVAPKKKQSVIAYYKRFGWKVAAKDVLHDVIGSILYAAGIYTFAATADFAPGGITGGAYVQNGHLLNCTIVDNSARNIGGVNCADGTVSNCVR